MKQTLMIALLAFVFVVFSAAQNGQLQRQQSPLPVFPVTTLDGAPVSSGDWNLPGRWVLIFVQSNCRSCGLALTQLRTVEAGSQASPPATPIDLGSSLVILVSGNDADTAKSLASQFPWLKNARWFIDSSQQGENLLGVHGAPAFFGVERSMIEWKFSGITSNPGRFNERLVKWMSSPLSAVAQAQLQSSTTSAKQNSAASPQQ